MNIFNIKYLIITIVLLVSCTPTESQKSKSENIPPVSQFGDYWYNGEAELTSYKLTQARYGEYREGTAVLVFVTEPFSKSKQVKLDNSSSSNEDQVTVLKMNFTKKFLTGIYPYSMMTSSFVPVSINQYPDALKVSTTSQEWCGHTFTQLNKKDGKYLFQQFSYFESEGDVEKNLKATWLEDELWQRTRINPESLPVGEINVLPGTMYLRLSHDKPVSVRANASLATQSADSSFNVNYQVYSLDYENRQLDIYFENKFPYEILGWDETYKSGFGDRGEMKTTARRMKSILSPYWNKNGNQHLYLRDSLGLE